MRGGGDTPTFANLVKKTSPRWKKKNLNQIKIVGTFGNRIDAVSTGKDHRKEDLKKNSQKCKVM